MSIFRARRTSTKRATKSWISPLAKRGNTSLHFTAAMVMPLVGYASPSRLWPFYRIASGGNEVRPPWHLRRSRRLAGWIGLPEQALVPFGCHINLLLLHMRHDHVNGPFDGAGILAHDFQRVTPEFRGCIAI